MKNKIRELLVDRDFDEIAAMAGQKKRVLGVLVSLTFDADPLIGWRAVEAMGLAADRIAEQDTEYVRSHLRRLHWLLSEESGGICRHAPQAIAEIIHQRPSAFRDYAGIVVAFLRTMAEEDLTLFRPAVLWAIARLATVTHEEVVSVIPEVTICLEDSNSQVRGLAVWCLIAAGREELLDDHSDLKDDDGEVSLYHDGDLHDTTVKALATKQTL